MLSREERQRNRRIENRINNPEFRQKWELYCKEYDMDQYERREFISWLEKGHSIKNHYHPRFLPDTGKLSFIEGYRLDRTIKRLLREKGWVPRKVESNKELRINVRSSFVISRYRSLQDLSIMPKVVLIISR